MLQRAGVGQAGAIPLAIGLLRERPSPVPQMFVGTARKS